MVKSQSVLVFAERLVNVSNPFQSQRLLGVKPRSSPQRQGIFELFNRLPAGFRALFPEELLGFGKRFFGGTTILIGVTVSYFDGVNDRRARPSMRKRRS